MYQSPDTIQVKTYIEGGSTLGGYAEFTNELKKKIDDHIKKVDLSYIEENILKKTADALVIDIEGGEKLLVDNDPKIPMSCKYVLIELHPEKYVNSEKDCENIIAKLKNCGFSLKAAINQTYLFERSDGTSKINQ